MSEALCAGLKADQAENRAETRSAEGTRIVAIQILLPCCISTLPAGLPKPPKIKVGTFLLG